MEALSLTRGVCRVTLHPPIGQGDVTRCPTLDATGAARHLVLHYVVERDRESEREKEREGERERNRKEREGERRKGGGDRDCGSGEAGHQALTTVRCQ